MLILLPYSLVNSLHCGSWIGIPPSKRGFFRLFLIPTNVTLLSYSKRAIDVPKKTYKISIFLVFISPTLFPRISTWKSKSALHNWGALLIFSLF
jgi:hypothetical protein